MPKRAFGRMGLTFSFPEERSVRRFEPRSGLGLPQTALSRLLPQPAPPDSAGSECCVCLQEIEEGTPSLRLQCCARLYHHPCIVQWLSVVARCPMCRVLVDPGNVVESADAEESLEGSTLVVQSMATGTDVWPPHNISDDMSTTMIAVEQVWWAIH